MTRSSVLDRPKPTPTPFLTNTQLVARSANKKTGPIPVTYRPVTTCPTTCVFLPSGELGGCYGTGRLFGLASKGSGDLTEAEAIAKLRGGTPIGARYLRDRVVGDVVNPDGTFDRGYLLSIAKIAAAVGITAFGYTHAWRLMSPEDVSEVAESGYVLNASCETMTDVAQAVFLGLPVVLTGDSWRDGEMVAGRRVVTCPAETHEDVTCSDCGLCTKPERTAVIRFHTHGVDRKQAARTVEALRKADEAA